MWCTFLTSTSIPRKHTPVSIFIIRSIYSLHHFLGGVQVVPVISQAGPPDENMSNQGPTTMSLSWITMAEKFEAQGKFT